MRFAFKQQCMVVMPAPDRAVYLELEHHLHALEMQKVKAAARGKKKFRDKSDRETRLSEAGRERRC